MIRTVRERSAGLEILTHADVSVLPEGPAGAEDRSSGKRAGRIGRAYERFLELPVPIVLAVLWAVGAAVLGSCAAALYLFLSLLLALVAA